MWSPTSRQQTPHMTPTHRKNKTLNKMLDIHPNSPFALEPNQQTIPNFHHVFRLKPSLPSRNLSNKPSQSHRSTANNTPRISPLASPFQSPTNSSARRVITWKDSLVSNSVFDSNNLHIRHNTMDGYPTMSPRTPSASKFTPIAMLTPREGNKTTFTAGPESPRASVHPLVPPISLKNSMVNPSAFKKVEKSPRMMRTNKGVVIDDEVRFTYSALVNSPKQSKIPSMATEIDLKGLDDKQLKKLSSKYLSQEEKDVVKEIETKGRKDLHDALSMYNRFHGNHLFEPQDKITGKSEYAIRVKSIIPEKYLNYNVSPSYTPYSSSLQKNFTTGASSEFGGGMVFKNHSLNEKFLQKVGSSMLQKRRNNNVGLGTLETNNDEEVIMQTLDDTGNVKKMNDLREMIKTERFLTKEEKEFLKLVKEDGTKIDIQFCLNNQKDLIYLKDNRKQTPLHWAVKRGNIEIVELLIKNGASLFEKDIASRTPVDIAKKLKYIQVARFLDDKAREFERIGL